jgi:putative CocE/NonD family hydrolase
MPVVDTQVRQDFPRSVRVVEHLTIPMPDGTELAAKLWLPADAEEDPVPAILEYIPYRKRDGTVARDVPMHHYVAGHGYACIRVDIRGSGDSQGVLTDEYLQSELDDGVAIIEWLAEQPWCDGNVGMTGISWGGFNGLQIAALRPPALKAIITVCSTDDRYADDVHYMGGCLLGDNLSWASVMLSYNSCPPDPALVGDAWRSMWHQRLEGSGLWLANWLKHQRRDDFWRHGSVCENYEAIQCPVFAISGWADGYSNAVFRLLENLEVPRLGLVGPWSHKYPHLGSPGPAIGFLQEALRWWDHWLKGEDTGIMNEPMVRAYMQDTAPPSTGYDLRPGRWVGEPTWPSDNVTTKQLMLAPGSALIDREPAELPLWVQSPLSVGAFAGKWCSYAAPPDLPEDQRNEDGGALVFDSAPLTEEIEIMGAPVVELDLWASEPVAQVAVRLSDVREDGAITRVTYGVLNLTHRNSHAEPEALVPGQRYRVRVQLNEVAQTFHQGHHVRVAISSSYWPLVWPAPKRTRLTIFTGKSRLLLPCRAPRPEDEAIAFGPPEVAPPPPITVIRPSDGSWRVIRELGRDVSTLQVCLDRGHLRFEDIGLETQARGEEEYIVEQRDWGSLRGETNWTRSFRRGDWHVSTRTRQRLTCDEATFYVDAEVDAYEGERRVFSQSFCERIPRDLV